MRMVRWVVVLAVVSVAATPAQAGLGSRVLQETTDFLLKKFGREAAQEGAERLTGRLAAAAARHGDELITAVRKVGPGAIGVVQDAGSNAPRVLRLLNRHGDDALRMLSRPASMTLVSRYGDDAAGVLIRHRAVAEPVLEALGKPAIGALAVVGPQGGRRLAMMAGDLAGSGHASELLGVIARHGDKAMEFVWKHRGVLAGGVALAAFLSNPEPFLDGTAELARAGGEAATQLAGTVAEKAVKPAVTAVGAAAVGSTGFIGLVALIVGSVLAAVAVLAVRTGLLRALLVRAGMKLAARQIMAAMRRRS